MRTRLSRMAVIAVVALLSTADGLHAQSDTLGASASTWAAQPTVGTDTAMLYLVRDGQRQAAITYIETVTRVADGFMLVQLNMRANGLTATLDTVVLAPGTLAPVWHADRTPAGSMRVAYAGGRLTGVRVDTAGQRTAVDTAVAADLLDFSAASSFFRLLPLRPGYAVVLKSWDVHRGVIHYPVRVTGEEEIDVAGAMVKTWKVETSSGGRTIEHWIDQRTRREVRATTTMGPMRMVMERKP